MDVDQTAICAKLSVECDPCSPDDMLGVARNFDDNNVLPINGLRHPRDGGTCGWYLWRGEFSSDPDSWSPLHVCHLIDQLPEVLPYLGLPPGWRFLLASGYEDTWFDDTLLSYTDE